MWVLSSCNITKGEQGSPSPSLHSTSQQKMDPRVPARKVMVYSRTNVIAACFCSG